MTRVRDDEYGPNTEAATTQEITPLTSIYHHQITPPNTKQTPQSHHRPKNVCGTTKP